MTLYRRTLPRNISPLPGSSLLLCCLLLCSLLPRASLAAAKATLKAKGPGASAGAPGAKAERLASEEGLRIGIVGWSVGPSPQLALVSELALELEGERLSPKKAKRKASAKRLEQLSVYRCPGFEVQDSVPIMDASHQGARARDAGWASVAKRLAEDKFDPSALRLRPKALSLKGGERVGEGEGARLRFSAPPALALPGGADLELSSLEGNLVISLMRPAGETAAGKRVAIQEFESGSFELSEAKCGLVLSPDASCVAFVCAQGLERPYLGAYLLKTQKLRQAK